MERSLLDTDIFSEVLRRRDSTIIHKVEAYLSAVGHLTVTVITIAELIDGYRRRQLNDHIDRLVEVFAEEGHQVLSLDFEAAQLAGRIFGDLHRTGQPIGRADPFIAAIAIRAELPLITGNSKHFERIQALGYPLRLDTWRSSLQRDL